MTYEIVRKTMSETPTLHTTCRVEHHQVADALAEALPKVFAYVMEVGAPMAGPPYVRYLDRSAAYLTMEPGIPLAVAHQVPDGRDDIEAGVLPAGPAAVTVHTGPYEQLADAYAAIDRWFTANDLEYGGPPWEVYLTDPGEVPDPADWKTQVIWPLA